MATKKKETKEVNVELIPINLQEITIRVEGESPLIVNKWSEKAKQEILDKHMKKAKKAKEAKDPQKNFENSLYKLEDGSYGFPSIAFKKAAITACSQLERSVMTKVKAKGTFHVCEEFVVINGVPRMREDMVRLSGSQGSPPDIRHRGEFPEWSADVKVKYNASVISAEQLVNLFNLAGFAVGVGEWRPERNGSFGMFHVKRG